LGSCWKILLCSQNVKIDLLNKKGLFSKKGVLQFRAELFAQNIFSLMGKK
jgi:hypothetical protein